MQRSPLKRCPALRPADGSAAAGRPPSCWPPHEPPSEPTQKQLQERWDQSTLCIDLMPFRQIHLSVDWPLRHEVAALQYQVSCSSYKVENKPTSSAALAAKRPLRVAVINCEAKGQSKLACGCSSFTPLACAFVDGLLSSAPAAFQVRICKCMKRMKHTVDADNIAASNGRYSVTESTLLDIH